MEKPFNIIAHPQSFGRIDPQEERDGRVVAESQILLHCCEGRKETTLATPACRMK
jgi:hypothetical protein